MGRPAGTRSKDFEAKRLALLDKIGGYLVRSLPAQPSLRQMAAGVGVTVPTLRHYFGSRDGVIAAYMERFGQLGEPYLSVARICNAPLEASIPALVAFIVEGLVFARVVDGHSVGLVESLNKPELGQVYLRCVLEPTLTAIETRLAEHQRRGEMRPVDTRAAALGLIGPLLLAALHQCELGGNVVRPLDLTGFGRDIAAAFLRSYRADGASRSILE